MERITEVLQSDLIFLLNCIPENTLKFYTLGLLFNPKMKEFPRH